MVFMTVIIIHFGKDSQLPMFNIVKFCGIFVAVQANFPPSLIPYAALRICHYETTVGQNALGKNLKLSPTTMQNFLGFRQQTTQVIATL